jgi:hypothetical protein
VFSLALTKLTTTLNKISTLANRIRGQAATVKAAFDYDVNVVKTFINETLTAEIDVLDAANVKKTGNQTIAGVKTFSSSPVVPAPTNSTDATNKTYIDTNFTTKSEITTNRKLSASGDFTGSWHGITNPVYADPGIANVLSSHMAENASIWKLKDGMLNLKNLFEFDTESASYKFVQGMGVTGQYIVIAVLDGTDAHNSWLYIFDKNTYELASLPSNPITDRSFGHCNDMTFNPSTNQFLIAACDGTKRLFLLDADTFDTEDTKVMPFEVVGIAYDNQTNQYIIDDGAYTYHIYNGTLTAEVGSFEVENYGVTKQGLETHNRLIYASFYDAGQTTPYQSANDPAMANTGRIYVYTFGGKLVKSYLLPSTMEGEVEGIAYLGNGKFLINYNFGSGICRVYVTDLLTRSNFNALDLLALGSLKVEEGEDLNNLIEPGTYRINGTGIAATLLNCPISVNGKLSVEYINNIDNIMQTVVARDNGIFTRVRDFNGVWSSWKQINMFVFGNLVEGDDLNDFIVPGTYKIFGTGLGSTLINYPSINNGILIIEYLQATDCIRQTVKTRDNRIYYRTLFEGTWSTWTRDFKIAFGSINIPIVSANTPASVHVDLTSYGFTSTPAITLAPITTQPQNCRVGYENASATGFDLYGVRTDAATQYTCTWIAVN